MRALLVVTLLLVGCDKDDPNPNPPNTSECEPDVLRRDWSCVVTDPEAGYTEEVGCLADFEVVAAAPFDASIPGARSSKTIVDTWNENHVFFTNSNLFPLHEMFVDEYLLELNFLPKPEPFINEYTSPDRRFLLGAVTWYEEPDVWAYEIAPYDTADEEQIAAAYRAIRDSGYFGDQLVFHPTSATQEDIAENLPADVCTISTADLFDGISYQALNLGTTTGWLKFYTAEQVDGVPIPFRELVVLDAVPNDIGITAGIITDAYQTPLSHINVLSQNRGTPNMSLIGAWNNAELRALEGQWVELTVGPFEWTVRPIDVSEADAWWEENKPTPLSSNPPDLSVTELTDLEDLLQLDTLSKADAITTAIPAFGGKASHFGGLVHIGPDCPTPDGFAIPIYFYDQFMTQNGFKDRLYSWLDPDHPSHDPQFLADPDYRQQKLHELQADMMLAPLDPTFRAELAAKIEADFPGTRMRFRSSTNVEDLGDFTGAGLYTSMAGYSDPNSDEPMDDAIRTVWGSVWNPRAYEERAYYSIDQRNVGMALLVHPSFPDEETNGVAITNNIFDPSGLEPAFYINAQMHNWSVVLPEYGVTSDQVLYYFDRAGQPIVYIGHSNIIPDGYTVLDAQQLYQLGTALKAIHEYFFEVYGDRSFYAMDTEFKFDDGSRDADGDGIFEVPGGERKLVMKQARPFPDR